MRNRKQTILDRLNPFEAKIVLMRLLSSNVELIPSAQELSRNLLGERSFQKVADELEEVLKSQTLASSPAQSGEDEIDQAQRILENALEPFIDDLQRMIDLDLEGAALEICQGILLALYNIRKREDGLFGLATDFPVESAAHVLSHWFRGHHSEERPRKARPEFPMTFAHRRLPAWETLIASVLQEN